MCSVIVFEFNKITHWHGFWEVEIINNRSNTIKVKTNYYVTKRPFWQSTKVLNQFLSKRNFAYFTYRHLNILCLHNLCLYSNELHLFLAKAFPLQLSIETAVETAFNVFCYNEVLGQDLNTSTSRQCTDTLRVT